MNPLLVKTLLIFFSCLLINSSFSQDVELPEVVIPPIQKTGIEVQNFVPSGWKIELFESGDLGGDGSREDYLLLLKMQDANNIFHDDNSCPAPLDTNPRMLVFLLARDGGYFLAGKNSTLIPRQDRFCDAGDPFDGVTGGGIRINSKQGVVDLGFWGSSLGHKSFHFQQWRNQGVYLVGCHYYSRHRYSGETIDIKADYIKRQVHYEEFEFDDSDEEAIITRDEIQSLPIRPLVPLEDVGVFYNFNCTTMSNYR